MSRDRTAGERRRLRALFLGRVPYLEAEALQRRLRDRLIEEREVETLLLLEHPPVITLGRNAGEGGVLAASDWLAERGVELVETDRGGQATFHGPGQLVGYPIVNLDPDRRDVRAYVRDLQSVLVRSLADFGVVAEPAGEERPIGVWVREQKIASIGVHLKRWVTSHGFALNLSTDLGFFSLIQPCGLDAAVMTSVERLTGGTPAVVEMARRCAEHFRVVFDRTADTVDSDELASWGLEQSPLDLFHAAELAR